MTERETYEPCLVPIRIPDDNVRYCSLPLGHKGAHGHIIPAATSRPDPAGGAMNNTADDWDGGFEDFIRCPFCGDTDEEYTEYPRSLNHDGDTAERDCAVCGETFGVTLCVSYSYATAPLFIGPVQQFGWPKPADPKEQQP
jgi:hypothetical protein